MIRLMPRFITAFVKSTFYSSFWFIFLVTASSNPLVLLLIDVKAFDEVLDGYILAAQMTL